MPREFSRTSRVGDFIKQELAGFDSARVARSAHRHGECDRRRGQSRFFACHGIRHCAGQRVGGRCRGIDNGAESCGGLFAQRRSLKLTMRARRRKLRFVFDVSIVRGAHMSKLIDDAVAVDREHAAERGDDGSRIAADIAWARQRRGRLTRRYFDIE